MGGKSQPQMPPPVDQSVYDKTSEAEAQAAAEKEKMLDGTIKRKPAHSSLTARHSCTRQRPKCTGRVASSKCHPPVPPCGGETDGSILPDLELVHAWVLAWTRLGEAGVRGNLLAANLLRKPQLRQWCFLFRSPKPLRHTWHFNPS